MVAKNFGIIDQIQVTLTTIFKIVDMELISFYLSLKVNQNHRRKIIKLFQPIYIIKILSKFYLA